jgi:hypothetical protein
VRILTKLPSCKVKILLKGSQGEIHIFVSKGETGVEKP